MFKVVIPARYGSTRLPGKPLLELGGKPLVEHVYRRAVESGAADVVIATDDERVELAARGFGATVCMTSPDHPSGTDRIAEVARLQNWPEGVIVVNLQGDEPLMPAALVKQVARDLEEHTEAGISTICTPIGEASVLFDTNVVKVVLDERGFALYFSRAPIPWDRESFVNSPGAMPAGGPRYLRHLGIYAYRVGFLHRYVNWRECAPEKAERLEQLRALHYGERIHVSEVPEPPPPGVDTEEELQQVEALLARRGEP